MRCINIFAVLISSIAIASSAPSSADEYEDIPCLLTIHDRLPVPKFKVVAPKRKLKQRVKDALTSDKTKERMNVWNLLSTGVLNGLQLVWYGKNWSIRR